jgi:transposase InsO family protein
VEACIAGEISHKGLVTKARVDHSLVHYWLKKYHAGVLSLELLREGESVESAVYIAVLDRTLGQFALKLDLQKKGGSSPPPRRATGAGSWYRDLRAEMIPTGPNQRRVSDITFVRLERAFVILVIVLDVLTRTVIGYAIRPTLDAGRHRELAATARLRVPLEPRVAILVPALP